MIDNRLYHEVLTRARLAYFLRARSTCDRTPWVSKGVVVGVTRTHVSPYRRTRALYVSAREPHAGWYGAGIHISGGGLEHLASTLRKLRGLFAPLPVTVGPHSHSSVLTAREGTTSSKGLPPCKRRAYTRHLVSRWTDRDTDRKGRTRIEKDARNVALSRTLCHDPSAMCFVVLLFQGGVILGRVS